MIRKYFVVVAVLWFAVISIFTITATWYTGHTHAQTIIPTNTPAQQCAATQDPNDSRRYVLSGFECPFAGGVLITDVLNEPTATFTAGVGVHVGLYFPPDLKVKRIFHARASH